MTFMGVKRKLNKEGYDRMYEDSLDVGWKAAEVVRQRLFEQLYVQLWDMIAGQAYREFRIRTTRLK